VAPCEDPSESSSESFSHGWGAWGVVDMIETLLGVTVTSPGAATVRIAPPDVRSLDRVKGSVWTQRGTVRVSWKRTRGGLHVEVDVPPNVRATVAIPGERTSSVGAGEWRFSPR
jgi:Bacterial alpha-L-rhamnosidase C-terminal domain